jgi:hypothetical protein
MPILKPMARKGRPTDAKIGSMRNIGYGNTAAARIQGRPVLRLRVFPAILILLGITIPRHDGRLLARPFPAAGREAQKHETRKATGLVTDVQPEQITIQSKDGTTLVLTAFEDYRDRVTVGSQVTALYYPQDNGNPVLKSLDCPAEVLFVPVGTIVTRVHRITLLPDSQIPDAGGLYDAATDYLHTALGWYVAPPYLAEEVRKSAQRSDSMLGAMDPRTGNFDMTAYLNGSESVIAKVASGTRSDAVLELNVVQVEAPVSRLEASWDGVDEPVAGAAFRTIAKFSMFPRRGELPAATVELKLWDAKGNLMWRNRRGLALLEVMNGKGTRLENRPLPAILADTQRIQRWMEAAFKAIGPAAGHP